MSYSWKEEVKAIRQSAQELRLKAARVRFDAEKRATALEADADRTEMRADGVERLCSRGADTTQGCKTKGDA
jgi:hypothetical protein